ncbi:MAG: thioredoxin [Chloroflexota bacterium]|nr:thioredoxin [Chloroflexota bacterium]
MAEVLTVDDGSFEESILKADVPMLVDFWAPWCAPCKAVAPILGELASEYEGKLGFARINVDEQPANASKYGITAIPTLLVFKGGQPVGQVLGFRPKAQLKKAIDEIIG